MIEEATDKLSQFLRHHGGAAGTFHEQRDDVLELVAAVNIPQHVQDLTSRIPKGKGMAGLAWERGVPVQTCNLQTDSTGDVQAGARAVEATGGVALPLTDQDGRVKAVLGIAFENEREFSQDELTTLMQDARTFF